MRSSEEGAHEEGALPDIDRIDHVSRLLMPTVVGMTTTTTTTMLPVVDNDEVGG